ncbi:MULTISPECIES: MFS transporter [unclassified Brevundimonas]|uniref:MFS transporter n=1 Tax=unclassified Brevundimonas TaxID=2622653 RepID=UPI0025C21F6E|nr:MULTISPECIES: MFS transporter [unclassified Brevundimonas]
MPPTQMRQIKWSLFVLFFMPGVALASWISRTPTIRDMLSVNVAEMGMVLFGLSVGAMTGVLGAGPVISHFGARRVTAVGMSSAVLSLLVLSLGTSIGDKYVAMAGLFLFGLGIGLCEIAINLEGTAVERATGTHVLHTLHGCFSLGTLGGALVGLALTRLGVPLELHLSVIAALFAAVVLVFVRKLPPATGQRRGVVTSDGMVRGSMLSVVNGRLLLIGLIVLAVALAEGSATDWLPILMVDEYGVSKTAASLVYVMFAASVTTGRLAGTPVLNRLGPVRVIGFGAVLAAIGMVAVIFGSQSWMAIAGVVAWGLGVSMSFPLAISSAGQGAGDPEQRVKLVSVMGYCAFLAGPPLLGLAGEHWGLRMALLVVLGFVMVATVISRAAGVPNPSAVQTGHCAKR